MTATTAVAASPSLSVGPLTMHVAPVVSGSPVIHVAPVSSDYTLYLVAPNGEKYPITLTKEKQAKFNALCTELNTKNDPHFSLNLQELTLRDGTFLYSNNEKVSALREFVHSAWTPNFFWKSQLPGHRTSASDPASFATESHRLKTLAFGDKEVEKALKGKTPEQKLNILKRDRAAKHLVDGCLDILGKLVPEADKSLRAQSQRKIIQGIKDKLEADRLEAILAFEAAHEAASNKQALENKQKVAKTWIEEHELPSLGFGEKWKLKQWSHSVDEEEQTRMAQDLARLGCKDKAEYSLLGANNRADGSEVFFVRLMEAVVENRGIEGVVNGPLFELVFGSLSADDQNRVKRELITKAIVLGGHLQSTSAAASLTKTSNDDDTTNSCFLPDAFDRMLNPKLKPNDP